MKSTEILIILALVGAGAWFGFSKKEGQSYNLAAPHQHQMDKAKAVQGQLESSADRQQEQSNRE